MDVESECFPNVMRYNGGREAQKSQHRKCWSRMAASHPLQHYPHSFGSWSTCPHLQNGSYRQRLELASFKERNDLLFGFFPWSLFGRLCLEKPGKPGWRRKICLALLIACPVPRASQLMPMPHYWGARQSWTGKRKDTEKQDCSSKLLHGVQAGERQLKIQPYTVLSKGQTAHWGPVQLCSDAKFSDTLKAGPGEDRLSPPVECSSDKDLSPISRTCHILRTYFNFMNSFPPHPPHTKLCNCGDGKTSATILTYERSPKRCIMFRWVQNFINPPSRMWYFTDCICIQYKDS